MLLSILGSLALAAPPSDAVLNALSDERVTVTMHTGASVSGELLGHNHLSLLVIKADGHIAEVVKQDILSVDGLREPSESNGCPWGASRGAYVTKTAVHIDGRTYSVNGPANRHAFASTLRDCGEDEAETAFLAWRTRRRAVNTHVGVLVGGAFIPFVSWVLVPVEAVVLGVEGANARARRNSFTQTLGV